MRFLVVKILFSALTPHSALKSCILTTNRIQFNSYIFWSILAFTTGAGIWYFRFSASEDVHRQLRLTNATVLNTTEVTSQIECNERCLIRPRCKSANFCYREICELNEEDIFSKGVNLESDINCVYLGMKRNFVPQCFEKGKTKDISDDNAGIVLLFKILFRSFLTKLESHRTCFNVLSYCYG